MASKTPGGVLVTPRFRLSFPDLLEPRSFGNAPAKYGTVMLFPPDTDLGNMKAALKACAMEKWGERPPGLKLPWHDGEEKGHLEGYEPGWTFLRCTTDYPPEVVDRLNHKVYDRGEIYPGRWARAAVNPYSYDNKFGRGVSFGLVHVQLLEPGPALGGRGPAEQIFDPVNDDEWLGGNDSDDSDEPW